MIWTRFNPATREYSEYDDGLPDPPNICFCLCCGFKTLPRHHWHEVCPVCEWEDVDQGDHNPDFRDPWNHMVSLTEARKNFLEFGACSKRMKKYVRDPLPEERTGAKSYR